MSIALNIKILKADKGLMQKEVYTDIGIKPAHYNKLNKVFVEPSFDILDKLTAFCGVTTDAIIHYRKATPKAITVVYKTATDQVCFMA